MPEEVRRRRAKERGESVTSPSIACDTRRMTIARAFALFSAMVTVFATLVLGFASSASADQVMEGVYDYSQDGINAELSIYPICVPTVGDLRDNLELPVACTLHIAPNTPLVNSGDARLTNGIWTYSTNIPDGYTCSDGSTAALQETYKIDDATMTGTRSVINNNICNGEVPAKIVNHPFTLSFNRPLSIPVDRYPLYCEPGGLKRCF